MLFVQHIALFNRSGLALEASHCVSGQENTVTGDENTLSSHMGLEYSFRENIFHESLFNWCLTANAQHTEPWLHSIHDIQVMICAEVELPLLFDLNVTGLRYRTLGFLCEMRHIHNFPAWRDSCIPYE